MKKQTIKITQKYLLNANKTLTQRNITRNNQKKHGFTLAEVLITLVIIGIIAAITVSSIIVSTQKRETVSKLKKAYSVLTQAVNKMVLTQGASPNDFSSMSSDENGKEFFNYFASNVNVVKTCTWNIGECFTKSSIKYLNGSEFATASDNQYSIITSDGIAYGFMGASYCGSNKGITTEDQENCIGRFVVDINGHRAPNKLGIDIFYFMIVDGKGVVPAGSANNSKDCTRSDLGITCAAKVLKEDDVTY